MSFSTGFYNSMKARGRKPSTSASLNEQKSVWYNQQPVNEGATRFTINDLYPVERMIRRYFKMDTMTGTDDSGPFLKVYPTKSSFDKEVYFFFDEDGEDALTAELSNYKKNSWAKEIGVLKPFSTAKDSDIKKFLDKVLNKALNEEKEVMISINGKDYPAKDVSDVNQEGASVIFTVNGKKLTKKHEDEKSAKEHAENAQEMVNKAKGKPYDAKDGGPDEKEAMESFTHELAQSPLVGQLSAKAFEAMGHIAGSAFAKKVDEGSGDYKIMWAFLQGLFRALPTDDPTLIAGWKEGIRNYAPKSMK
jgi:hypothetical protein